MEKHISKVKHYAQYNSLLIKKAECQRIDAFELWCWRRLLRVPWTARRSNPSILKEINLDYSLEGLMLKLQHQYLGHLIRDDSLEKTLMLGKTEGIYIHMYIYIYMYICIYMRVFMYMYIFWWTKIFNFNKIQFITYFSLTYCSSGILQTFFSSGGASGKEPDDQHRRSKRCRFDPWIRKIPWRMTWQTTPVFLPGESQGQRGLAG